MASKAKKRGKKRSADTLFSQVQRNLEKGHFKQALKDAKVCYRQEATEEHRQFLEFAFIGRAQELQRKNMRDACCDVLERLLELGPREPAVHAALPDLLLWAGMLDQLPASASTADMESGQWERKVADQGVLQPDRVPDSMPHIRQGAERIRSALQALYEGDHAAMELRLRDVARDSPFADWKLFVRGLSAYYQNKQDSERMQANWSRLDPDRVAARIARVLNVVAGGVRPANMDHQMRSALARVEQVTQSSSLFNQLNILHEQVRDGSLRKAIQTLHRNRRAFCEHDPGLYQRLVRCLYSVIVHAGELDDVELLAKTAEPLPLDPHWNRARALARELSDEGDLIDSIPYWRRYIDDLQDVAVFNSASRSLAQALVWLHMGRGYREMADAFRYCQCGASHDAETREAVEDAECCLEDCLRLAPDHVPAYEALAELFTEADEPDRVAATYRRALEQVPDYFDAMMHLAHHYLRHDEPHEAQRFALQARHLKPLDRQVTALVRKTHAACARDCANREEIDRARAELEQADGLTPEKQKFMVLAQRAVLEVKAGCNKAASQWIEQAQQWLEEPAPLWLLMMIEGDHYGLPKEELWLYEKRWTSALKRRCRGTTAGRMCEIVLSQRDLDRTLDSVAAPLEPLVAYVKRCSRVKWQEADLRTVCTFLKEIDEHRLLQRYVGKGTRLFPATAYFHALNAQVEVQKASSLHAIGKAQKSLQTAFDLAKESNDPADRQVLEEAQLTLTLLEELDLERLSHVFSMLEEELP